LEDDLIAGPVRGLAAQALSSGMAEEWFFLRYSDPQRHLRLRFRGQPERLLQGLLPAVSAWAADLVEQELCQRFVVDTYEREIERFGGSAGMATAETLFAADSQAAADLLELLQIKHILLDRMTLAILSVDALLDGLGLDAKTRSEWGRKHVLSRRETSGEYRERKGTLRALLADGDRVRREPGGDAIAAILDRLRQSAGEAGTHFAELERTGELARPLDELSNSFVHLHLNRLLGADGLTERRVLGLLWRARAGLQRAPAS
jgi:thiopeptide-type bacteriocin biosynthesis protein